MRTLLVKFTSFGMKLPFRQTTRKLFGFGVHVDEDFAPEIRNIRKGLIPYLKDTKRTPSLSEERQITCKWMPL